MSTESERVDDEVREYYANAARTVSSGAAACCGPDQSGFGLENYDDLGDLPEAAALASIGCGNPIAVADLHEGETVLDLGSGGGIDVLLSAKRVGPTGFAYGLDMTPEMLDLAAATPPTPAPPTSSSSKAGWRRSRCPTGRSMSSSPTASSTCRPTSRPSSPRPIACFALAADRHQRRRHRGSPHRRGTARAGSYVGCIAGALPVSEYHDGLACRRVRRRVDHVHQRRRRRRPQRDRAGDQTSER